MTFHTSNWNPLGSDVYYRLLHLYDLKWWSEYQINIESFQIISSPFAGCIALVEKAVKRPGLTGSVWVFTASGRLVSVLKDIAESVILLFFTREEHLVTVTYDGQVCIYELKGTLMGNYLIDHEVREQMIHEAASFCHSCSTGFAVMTKTGRFFVVPDVHARKVDKYPLIPDPSMPTAWCVISSEEPAILVAQGKQLSHLTSKRCMPTSADMKDQEYESIERMCSSMSGNNVALQTDKRIVWFGQVSQDGCMTCRTEFDKTKAALDQMVCAGPEAVICVWRDKRSYATVVIGFDGYFFSLFLKHPMRLVPEVDGVRVISNDSHELIEFVPSILVNTYRIGSLSGGAFLLSARKEFDKKSYKADENLKMIGHTIEAVRECIDAATHEYHVSDQKTLLEAALLGKNFNPVDNCQVFMDSCKTLRVLNQVRELEVGIPLTFKEYQELGLDALINRLISRGNYSTAVNICEFLGVKKERGVLCILKKWAIEKVHESEFDDNASADKIKKKLGPRPGISYSDIAQEAVKSGRKLLAIRLLDSEVKASKQIPLLLLLEQHQTAIIKAIDSQDPHLLYSVVQKLHRQFPEDQFKSWMMGHPEALMLMSRVSSLHGTLSILDEDNLRNAMSHLKKGLETMHSSSFELASVFFKKGKQDFAVSVVDEQVKLIRQQTRMKDKSEFDWHGLSIADTIKALLKSGKYRVADDARKEFKVSEKRFWWIKLQVLVEKRDWTELDKFSKTKKSPIGYEPFVDVCLKAGERQEATKYVHRVETQWRVSYLVKVG